MHIPALLAVYLLVAALFAAYTCFEILRTSVKLRPSHGMGIALCSLWPALIVVAFMSALKGRLRIDRH